METPSSWTELIKKFSAEKKLSSRTCKTYIKHQSKDVCQCGRLRAAHSIERIPDESLGEKNPETKSWNELSETKKTSMMVYGVLPRNNAKFIRCDNRQSVKHLYELILEDRKKVRPSLLISAFGGAKYFTLSERLEKDFVTGIIDLATRAGRLTMSLEHFLSVLFLIR